MPQIDLTTDYFSQQKRVLILADEDSHRQSNSSCCVNHPTR